MFFEGSEKKAEIIIDPSFGSLLELPVSFWENIVGLAKADILSSIDNEHCTAYLLSESSLFVWQHKVVILTCGLSTLIDSICALIDTVGSPNILGVTYQRKNEYLAHLQNSTFEQDIQVLRQKVPGSACRIGHLDTHHHYIFTSHSSVALPYQDNRYELLMYHISGPIAQYLTTADQSIEKIAQLLQLDKLFNGFQLDAHLFNPCGYSVNGIKGDEYFTIHITPQEKSSYVSIETNVDLHLQPINITAKLLALLQPQSWDIKAFNSDIQTGEIPENICLGHCFYSLKQGYNIQFSHYQQICSEVLTPEFM
ncbi:S-adenosylmethionine decarboxylase proenzyme [Shewanella gaetbuli]|uniref:S-adenosylmethionine decarboxylase proenzyme n=1 Tax=Shewanella gaetbuli TaxID=220752 RepID=A0A9X1ZS14_9GAMM|nr:S-adenosylmethionine decarboxylase proenzyme [Shewanella gaetbuli]MCL1143038.1 S-adenosylmethionine decarboxylase proenzyme [Shewanella gaetbuli]